MKDNYTHLSDEELLRLADGELSSRRAARVNAHLAGCWDCRARLRQFEGTIANFVDLHHATVDSRIPSATGPRALLSARLAEASASPRQHSWAEAWRRAFARQNLGYAAAAMFIVLASVLAFDHLASRPGSAMQPIPDRHLTPGVSRPVSTSEVCTETYSDDAAVVPAAVKQRVFQEYGMAPQSTNYELDYLISPQLGGTDDVRNLWPEPAAASAWNARDKDALENRLHQLVCQNKIDLSTAQRDLATDWISAYKKYFHTDRPIEPL
ncbi:MAG: zf-HC2 domain-containing protein [Candidatus Korobacteraceae bacterium]